jgi:uncharacterized glyoxalase superfamily protein PhnB
MSGQAVATESLVPSITPHLICADALKAIDFYRQAFGAIEELKLIGPTGRLVHAGLKIGGSMLMLAEENPDWGSLSPLSLKGTPVVIHLVVPDVDATIRQAEAAGATVVMPATDMFWGDRYGQVRDPFGHLWSVATPVRSLTPAEIQEAMMKTFASGGPC